MRFVQTNLAPVALVSLIFGVCLLPSATAAGAPRTVARVQEKPKPEGARTVLSPEAGRGLEFFDQGNFKEAVKSLKQATRRREDDATAWHFLGLAHEQLGKQKDARKALEKAVVLRLFRLAPHLSVPRIKPWDELSAEEKAERRRERAAQYREALASVERYVQLNPPDGDFWRRQHEALSLHVRNEAVPEAEKEVFLGNDEGIVKARVIYKPEPLYTDTARNNRVSGSVVLRGLFASDGKVKQILALVMLPDGLTEKSIEAMRKIQFVPAAKDGRPVSVWVTIEYGFTVF